MSRRFRFKAAPFKRLQNVQFYGIKTHQQIGIVLEFTLSFFYFVRTFWMDGFTRTKPPLSRVYCVGLVLYYVESNVRTHAHSRAWPAPSLTSPGYGLAGLPPTITIPARRLIIIEHSLSPTVYRLSYVTRKICFKIGSLKCQPRF